MQIRTEQSFILYANCSVNYDGRAKSDLKFGNYLILHKSDGTLLIHGGTLCTPRNYQSPGAVLYINNHLLISKRKNETIKIIIKEIINYIELSLWSDFKINITKTESDLRDFIIDNINDFIPAAKEVFKEFKTPVGPIDILVIDKIGIYHVIEVKRNKASLNAVSQLDRYSNYLIDIGKCISDYIASPDISEGALKLMINQNQKWLKVNYKYFNNR